MRFSKALIVVLLLFWKTSTTQYFQLFTYFATFRSLSITKVKFNSVWVIFMRKIYFDKTNRLCDIFCNNTFRYIREGLISAPTSSTTFCPFAHTFDCSWISLWSLGITLIQVVVSRTRTRHSLINLRLVSINDFRIDRDKILLLYIQKSGNREMNT